MAQDAISVVVFAGRFKKGIEKRRDILDMIATGISFIIIIKMVQWALEEFHRAIYNVSFLFFEEVASRYHGAIT